VERQEPLKKTEDEGQVTHWLELEPEHDEQDESQSFINCLLFVWLIIDIFLLSNK